MRVTERQQILILVAVTLFVGVMAVAGATALPALFRGNLDVQHYDAVFYENGTLVERYTYDVRSAGEYRMLYRYWNAPLTFAAADRPHIEFLGMTAPPGTVGYVRDSWGEVRIAAGTATPSEIATIRNLAFDSEVGIFNPGYFAPGTYTVEYRYRVRPPVEYDEEWAHLNLKLVDEHVSYRDLRITLPFAGDIEEVYTHPPTLAVERTAEGVVITGSAPQDDALNVELILDPAFTEKVGGFGEFVPDVRQQTADANHWSPILYAAAGLLYDLAILLVLAMPFVLLGVYLRYGREKPFTVPEYLSFTPNTALKPWQVNLLFKGDALEFDDTGFYATSRPSTGRVKTLVTEKPDDADHGPDCRLGGVGDSYEQRVPQLPGRHRRRPRRGHPTSAAFAATARRSPATSTGSCSTSSRLPP